MYYLPDDYSQARDLAAEHPEKLAELKALFWEEAEANNVLPLMAGFSVFFGILPPMPTATTMTFYGDVENIASGMIPRIYGHSYTMEAELHIPAQGAEGVILAEADAMGGFSLWVDNDGRLHHSYSMMGVEQYRQFHRAPTDGRHHGGDAVRRRRPAASHRRRRESVCQPGQDRRGPHREDRPVALLGVRRNGRR